MAQVNRRDHDYGVGPAQPDAPDDRRYDAGGHIARLHEDLAQRLATTTTVETLPAEQAGAERLVRLLSVAGGYGALLAGYIAVGAAIAHFF